MFLMHPQPKHWEPVKSSIRLVDGHETGAKVSRKEKGMANAKARTPHSSNATNDIQIS